MRAMSGILIAMVVASGFTPAWAQEPNLEERRARRTEALTTGTIGAGYTPASISYPPASAALTLDDALVLSAPTFYGDYPFLHRDGDFNTALGLFALDSIDDGTLGPVGGTFNTAVGHYALTSNTTGSGNVAVGSAAMRYNVIGYGNTAIGDYALRDNVVGRFNTAVGQYALTYNTGPGGKPPGLSRNTAVGFAALRSSTTGSNNVAVGDRALQNMTYQSGNVALGSNAGAYITGYDNVAIGNYGVAGVSNTLWVGNQFLQNRTFISGIRGITTGEEDAISVVIDSDGQLGTTSSSRRFKDDIRDMAGASGRLKDLRPVTFRYKRAFADGERPMQFGLVAEEVAEVMPELVVRDSEGHPEAVKYRLLSVLLLNEMQRLVDDVDDLRSEVERLRADRGAGTNLR